MSYFSLEMFFCELLASLFNSSPCESVDARERRNGAIGITHFGRLADPFANLLPLVRLVLFDGGEKSGLLNSLSSTHRQLFCLGSI